MSANQLGQKSVQIAIQSGGDLAQVMNSFLVLRHTEAGGALIGGALSCIVAAFDALRKAGYRFRWGDRELDSFARLDSTALVVDVVRSFNGGDYAHGLRVLSAMCGAVDNMRSVLSFRDDATTEPTPVREPIEVRVIAMPDRLVETVPHRNDEGQIIKTVQVQSDIKWPTPAN